MQAKRRSLNNKRILAWSEARSMVGMAFCAHALPDLGGEHVAVGKVICGPISPSMIFSKPDDETQSPRARRSVMDPILCLGNISTQISV
jgi:hypothetical protein